jgi:hypothetical protein
MSLTLAQIIGYVGFGQTRSQHVESALSIPFPKSWPAKVRSAMLQVVSLAKLDLKKSEFSAVVSWPRIVDAILYLETAAFVTGETLYIDGGAHAGHW